MTHPALWTPDRRIVTPDESFWRLTSDQRDWLIRKGGLTRGIAGGTRQYFADMVAEPLPTAFPTITAITETVLVPTLFTPIPALEPKAGKVYKLTVGGTCTTGLAGTLIIMPRYGTVIGGTALVTSFAQNYVPSITLAPFILQCWLVIRSLGQPGANGNAVCSGSFESLGAIATASSGTNVNFGSVTAGVAVDTTIASALWLGVTFSVAPSVIPIWHMWQPLN